MTSVRGVLSPGNESVPGATSTPQTPSTARASATVPASRVDRLLRERIRKSRSAQALDHLDEWEKWEQDFVPIERVEPAGGRLIVVANRLPVTCSKDGSGRWKLQISAGGLVSALMGVNNYSTLWIGWPGIYVKPGRDRDALAAMLQREGYIPVWLESGLLDLYYNGFCNSVLWQLFHYVPLQLDGWQRVQEHQTLNMQWGAYQQANDRFGEVVLAVYQPGDMVWVQDYHLMLLPSILKNAVPRAKVGWFLHTPFPSSEIYRTLPVREDVLRATLRADLIGFHTYDYARHFISSCTRILGLEGTPEGVEDNGSVARVAAFPIGIDPERFAQALETEDVQMNIAKLLNRYAGRKVMLGVDRLDMIKGIPQKLLAFEKFLHEHPEWRDKVLLVQIAVPSRTDVPEYQKLRSMVHEIVGRINGAFGTLTYVPIHHLDRQLSFYELCALYAVTDVALITSLRDGMNLVSYEYVACQADNAGVLVLSEFAGAAQSLGAGSILVNPWNINDVAAAIEDALTMSEEERRERHRQNYMHVATHTAQTWADTFISELNDTHIEADLRLRHTPPELDFSEVVRAYQVSSRRLIVLGYNATLTSAVEAPRQPKRHYDQIKSLARVNPRVLKCLQELCADPDNEVLIFSGSEMGKLEETFGDLPVWLAAENGVYVRPPQDRDLPLEWKCLFDTLPKEWMESVQLVLDYFCERTPRSFVEVRDTSLVWNYKHADVEFGRLQARDLLQHLWTGPISNAPVEIIQGGRSVEVRPVGVTKGLAMQRILGYMASIMGRQAVLFDFVLCIGHLLARDENMYLLFEGHKLEGATRADLRAAVQQAAPSTSNNSNSVTTAAGGTAAANGPTAASLDGHPILGSQLLQQQFPLHAICEAEEHSHDGLPSPSSGIAAWLQHAVPDSRSGATAVGESQKQQQQQGLGVGGHRLFSNPVPVAAAAVDSSKGGDAQITPAAADVSSTQLQEQQLGSVIRQVGSDGSKDASLLSEAPTVESSTSSKPSTAVTAGLPPKPPAPSARDAPAAANAVQQDTAGVYAAAKSRRNQRQKEQQQQQQQQQQHHQQQQTDDLRQDVAASNVSNAGTGLHVRIPHHHDDDITDSTTSKQQQQQQQDALPRKSSPPLPHLDGPPHASSPSMRHKRTSSGSSSRDFNGLDAGSAGNSSSFSVKGLQFPPENLFTCSVGRSRSKARYSLAGSSDVGGLLEAVVHQGIHGLTSDEVVTAVSPDQINHHHHGHRERDGTSGGGGGGTTGVTSVGGSESITSYTAGTVSVTSSTGGVGPGVSHPAIVSGTSSDQHTADHQLEANPNSGSEAILRAIEAASAQRRYRQQLQRQIMVGGAQPFGQDLERSSEGRMSGPGIITQGSLQGFAGVDALIGPALGTSVSHLPISAPGSWGSRSSSRDGGVAAAAGTRLSQSLLNSLRSTGSGGHFGGDVHDEDHTDDAADGEHHGLSWHVRSSQYRR